MNTPLFIPGMWRRGFTYRGVECKGKQHSPTSLCILLLSLSKGVMDFKVREEYETSRVVFMQKYVIVNKATNQKQLSRAATMIQFASFLTADY